MSRVKIECRVCEAKTSATKTSLDGWHSVNTLCNCNFRLCALNMSSFWRCWLCLETRWKIISKNAFITSFVADFQVCDMYALVVATHVCSSEDGNDDDINFWIDNFLLSQ